MQRCKKILNLSVLGAVLWLAAACAPAAPPPAPTTDHTVGTVRANDITIAYETFGPANNEPVLLLGGTGQQLIDWPLALIQELVRRGYRPIVFDNRDIGLSTHFTDAGLPDSAAITQALQQGKPPPFPYTLRDMANDAVALLDALDIPQAHIVGISMGGAIAQLVAIDHPDRALSLTLLMTNSGNPAIPVIAKPEKFANVPPMPALDDKPGFIDYQVKTMQALDSPGYPRTESEIRALVEADVARAYDPAGFARQQTVSLLGVFDGGYRHSHLANINVPVVILQGEDDPLVPVESARDLESLIPGAELRLVPGLGHGIPDALVPQFADAITTAATGA